MAGIDSPADTLSLATGGTLEISKDEPSSLVGRIAARVAQNPDVLVRSYRLDGGHAEKRVADLWDRAGDVAAALSSAGAPEASFIVVLTDDVLDYAPAFWGCLRGGFVPVALMAAARDAAYRQDSAFQTALASLGNPVLLVDDGFASLIESGRLTVPRPVIRLSSISKTASPSIDIKQAGDLAYLLATSGSTGRMKLVALSEPCVLHRSFPVLSSGPQQPRHNLGLFPLDGVSGHHVLFLNFASWTQLPSQAFYSRPRAVLDALETFGIEILGMTNSMLRTIVADEARSPRARNLSSLRQSASAPSPSMPARFTRSRRCCAAPARTLEF